MAVSWIRDESARWTPVGELAVRTSGRELRRQYASVAVLVCRGHTTKIHTHHFVRVVTVVLHFHLQFSLVARSFVSPYSLWALRKPKQVRAQRQPSSRRL